MDGVNALRAVSSLQRRTFTAFLLGPLVIAVILWLPTAAFALFFTLALLLAGWEWCALAGIRSIPSRARLSCRHGILHGAILAAAGLVRLALRYQYTCGGRSRRRA